MVCIFRKVSGFFTFQAELFPYINTTGQIYWTNAGPAWCLYSKLSYLVIMSKKEFIDLLEFIPEKIICNSGKGQEVSLNKTADDEFISISYIIDKNNHAEQEFSITISRFISKTKETFEIFGLLQAEMGKTQNGCMSFPNHEYQIINKIIKWFKKELHLDKEKWKWSIKVNINEPIDQNYKREVEEKVINYWLNKTKVTIDHSYPKKVTYIQNTENTKLKFYDKGTLVLEYKNNLFSSIIKNLVKKITYEKILNYETDFIQGFMKGIIAGEGCIFHQKETFHRSVYISVTKEEEKEIYFLCLKKLGIAAHKWKDDKLVVSKIENNIQLLKQRLMTLSKEKYSKFLNMMREYPNIKEETDYFIGNHKNQWNKIPEIKINHVLELYNSGITNTKQIAERVGISPIKINRILKANNLGRRVIKTQEEKRKEIAEFVSKNQHLGCNQIAELFNISSSAVSRACRKYGVKKVDANKFRILNQKFHLTSISIEDEYKA